MIRRVEMMLLCLTTMMTMQIKWKDFVMIGMKAKRRQYRIASNNMLSICFRIPAIVTMIVTMHSRTGYVNSWPPT